MHHSREPSLVSPVSDSIKSSEPPRLRNRLRKKFPSLRRPAPVDSSTSNKLTTAVGLVAQQAGTVGQPSLRLSPDLSDSKWHEYLRTSSTQKRSPHHPKVSFDTSVSATVPELIPELSHLTINNSKPRPSLDSSLASPTSSISTRSSMRRRAKTPVYTIGQLESTPGAKDPVVIDRSSVDLIAKQYQALIESQDSNSICTDTRSDPPPSRQSSRQSSYTSSSLARSTCSAGEVSEDLRPDVYQSSARTYRRHVSAHSPTSDDGTLVAFDEEAIYFKPMSFSPQPSSPSLPPTPPPRSRARVQRSSEFPAPDHNLSLQICTDLLARELSTVMIERPRGSGEDISSLQIWVMIEAYERLRDQVKDKEGEQHLEPMFDTWLAALYALHDKLTNDANSFQSHYETTGAD